MLVSSIFPLYFETVPIVILFDVISHCAASLFFLLNANLALFKLNESCVFDDCQSTLNLFETLVELTFLTITNLSLITLNKHI